MALRLRPAKLQQVMTLFKTQLERNNKPNRRALHDLGLAIGNLSP
jgi:hypothetical protein